MCQGRQAKSKTLKTNNSAPLWLFFQTGMDRVAFVLDDPWLFNNRCTEPQEGRSRHPGPVPKLTWFY